MAHELFDLNSYDYFLPEELLAQEPADRRVNSRLMNFSDGALIQHMYFSQISEIFKNPVLFVRNNTKVRRCRLFAKRATGARIEVFVIRPLTEGAWKVFCRPAKRVHEGEVLAISQDARVEIIKRHEMGEFEVRFQFDNGDEEALFERFGETPLPPYIKDFQGDPSRYQTVYAKHTGAAAAPTAGLHFDEEIIKSLEKQGHRFLDVTLHVGPGTFKPIETSDIRDYQIHSEFVEISEETASQLKYAKQNGIPVVAVGTTSLRSIESAWVCNQWESSYKQDTNIYLYPGKPVQSVDYLLTNFHLPKSSLLVLVAALIGKENLDQLYREAISQKYRFYSFGDAMILPNLSKDST
jgi:S-adenosylmethionine:tRNA ribosyltransferase-isomerase